MKIDRKLNLVLPLERDDGTTLYVFSMPVSLAVFERYYLVIAKVFSRLYSEDVTFLGGPRVCALLLKEIAQHTPGPDGTGNRWDGPEGVENGLLNEIRRMTNVIAMGEDGWQTVPYADALKRSLMSPEEASEVDGYLCFFTFNSLMQKRSMGRTMSMAAASLWEWQVTSSSISDYLVSLTTSTEAKATPTVETA